MLYATVGVEVEARGDGLGTRRRERRRWRSRGTGAAPELHPHASKFFPLVWQQCRLFHELSPSAEAFASHAAAA